MCFTASKAGVAAVQSRYPCASSTGQCRMCRWSETPDHRLQWEICQISSGWCALEFVLRSFSWNGRWSPLVWGEWRLFHLGQVSWVHGKATFICYILSSSNMGENIGVTVLREADGQLALSWNEGGQQSPVVLLHQRRHYDLLVPLPNVAARNHLQRQCGNNLRQKDEAPPSPPCGSETIPWGVGGRAEPEAGNIYTLWSCDNPDIQKWTDRNNEMM